MYQHNHWKIKQFFNILIKPVLWIFVGLVIFSNFLSNSKMTFNRISTLITIITIVLGIVWNKFEKTWWKHTNIQKILSDNYKTPVVEGRWKGILVRDGDEHDFVVEIKQTFMTISCATYSKHSYSKSIFAEILYNDAQKTYQIVYLWDGKTESTYGTDSKANNFYGLTILDIKNDKLEGEYFTNRLPKQTQGKIILNSRQKELKNTFDD